MEIAITASMRQWIVCSILIGSIGSNGCSADTDSAPPASGVEPRSEPAADPASDLSPEEVERLTTLGYLDSAPEPADADRSGAIVHAASDVAPGITLYTNHRPCRSVLMDSRGRASHSWSRSDGCPNWVNTRLLRSGELLVIEGKGGLALHGWDGEIRWQRRIGAHHDANPMADGRFAVLLHEYRRLHVHQNAEALASPDGVGPPLPTRGDSGTRIVDDLIAVVSPDGVVLEQQSIFDLLDADASIQVALEQAPDVLHTNSVEWLTRPELAREDALYSLDNVLVSIRNQDRIAIVNWTTRRVVWSWGPGSLDNQHDATLLENGHILLFDNGLRRGWSRVLEVDPRSDEIVWEYGASATERFFSKGRGAVQRLPNGNTLISVSDSGYAIEVTPDRRIVWEFHNPITIRKDTADHRAPIWVRRYPPDWLVSPRPTSESD